MTLDIAHRGASRDAPENTLDAFALAIEQGADMIETDLHLSADGQVPLFHDMKLGGRAVSSLTLSELREQVPGLPTLEETLDRFGPEIGWNLELKTHPKHDYPGLEARVLAEVKKRGLLERTLFSCFFDTALARLREIEPAARIGLLVSRRSNLAIAERAERLGAEAVHPELSLADEALVADLHARGYRVNVYTVDDPEDQRRLIGWGIDGIFTNVPAQLRAILDD